jgi:predicted enzyme related to lactoylglutathione lyase
MGWDEEVAMAARLWSVVFDCREPIGLGRWWAETLGWRVTKEVPQEVTVEAADEDRPFSCVFIPVPEPKAGKNRLHLDLASASLAEQAATVERLLSRGARRIDIGQKQVPWVVLADPEGNEFCVLSPRERYMGASALAAIVVDAAAPAALASFWAEAAGWLIGYRSDDVVSLHRPGGRPPDIDFVRVAEAKTVKNRVHLDVAPRLEDNRDAEVNRLIALGARRVDVGQGPEVTWVVLADPEGNEFCVLRPR